MSHPNEDFLNNWFDRIWNRNDPLEKVSEAFEEYWCVKAAVGGMAGDVLETHEQVIAFIELFRDAFEDISFKPHTFFHNEPWTHFKIDCSMRHKENKKEVKFQGFCEVRIDGGKIREATNYVDFVPILEQMGALPCSCVAKAFMGQPLAIS